jgi:hypothetical protein
MYGCYEIDGLAVRRGWFESDGAGITYRGFIQPVAETAKHFDYFDTPIGMEAHP